MRARSILLSILWCIFATSLANAGVVRWDNIDVYELPDGYPYSHDVALYIHEVPSSASDFTAMAFNYIQANSTMSFSGITADEDGSEWFFVNHGDVISKDLLDSGTYTPFNQPATPVVVPNHFYLAGHAPFAADSTLPDVYGWIEFLQTPTGLEMRDNAAAYGAASLTTGSFDFVPVPDPATWMLLLMGAATLTAAGIRSNRHATGRA